MSFKAIENGERMYGYIVPNTCAMEKQELNKTKKQRKKAAENNKIKKSETA